MKKQIMRILIAIFCLSVMIFNTTVLAAAPDSETKIKDTNVQFIHQDYSSASTNALTPYATQSSLVYTTGGGVNSNNTSSGILYQVWGWSTCNDAVGTVLYHYTRARFEQALSGRIFGDSGRVWGSGKVYAYGGWCIQDIRDSSYARVYYGV